MLTLTPLADDPRARRAVAAAEHCGIAVEELSLPKPALPPAPRTPRAGPLWREARGAVRVLRLLARTIRLIRGGARSVADVVHVNDLDALPAGFVLARRLRARLVYDAHELYTGFDADPPRAWLRLASIIEGSIARRCAAVLTVSEPIATALTARHRLRTRPQVVLNVPPLTDLPGTGSASDGVLRAVYQASVGPGRHLTDLLPLEGVELSARVLGAREAPPGVRLLDPVEPSELVSALAEFDVGIVIDRLDTENARLALPNKLFEYLMAGLAVAVPEAPAMAELVRSEGVGIVYPPGELAAALAELASDRSALVEMRRRARAIAVERYNAEAQRPLLYKAWGL